MSDDEVERLAKVLYEEQADHRHGRPVPWEKVAEYDRHHFTHRAERLLAAGVKLEASPTPPRATPLEAAAAALAAFDGIAWDAMMRESREIRRRGASSILAAAVGALSDEAVIDLVLTPSGDGLRAALLARLTEGGN